MTIARDSTWMRNASWSHRVLGEGASHKYARVGAVSGSTKDATMAVYAPAGWTVRCGVPWAATTAMSVALELPVIATLPTSGSFNVI